MSAWYYEPQYAKAFLKFRVSREEVLKLFGMRDKDMKNLSEQDPQTMKRIKSM